jgi:hypothetical protein
MLTRLKDFFIEKQPTLETALEKAERAGWQIEQVASGYVVRGQNHEGKSDSWQFSADQIESMNYILDEKLSVDLGDQYRLRKWGLHPGEVDTSDEWNKRKYEIREYRVKTYYQDAYKPGWKKLLGL